VLSEALQFVWTHVNQQSDDPSSYYELDLVEVLPGQSPETAIAVNPNRFNKDQLNESYLDFPQIERPLDTGKVYAWKVIAYTDSRSTTKSVSGTTIYSSGNNVGRKELAQSDVGYFVCGGAKDPTKAKLPTPQTNYFIDLEHWSENQTYFFNTHIPVSLRNPYGTRTLSIKIFNDQQELLEDMSTSVSLDPGLNQFNIDLSSESLDAKRFYFAELRFGEEERRTIKLYKQ